MPPGCSDGYETFTIVLGCREPLSWGPQIKTRGDPQESRQRAKQLLRCDFHAIVCRLLITSALTLGENCSRKPALGCLTTNGYLNDKVGLDPNHAGRTKNHKVQVKEMTRYLSFRLFFEANHMRGGRT